MEYNGGVFTLLAMLLGCDQGLDAALILSPDSTELRVLETAAEVRILRGGMDRTIDEPEALDAFINALAVEQATYDAAYPRCMPVLWVGLSDEARQPLASVAFCESSGAGVVQLETLGARTVSPERADVLRRLATETVEQGGPGDG